MFKTLKKVQLPVGDTVEYDSPWRRYFRRQRKSEVVQRMQRWQPRPRLPPQQRDPTPNKCRGIDWPSCRLRPQRDPPRFLKELLSHVTIRQWYRDMLESELSTRKEPLPYLEELVKREKRHSGRKRKRSSLPSYPPRKRRRLACSCDDNEIDPPCCSDDNSLSYSTDSEISTSSDVSGQLIGLVIDTDDDDRSVKSDILQNLVDDLIAREKAKVLTVERVVEVDPSGFELEQCMDEEDAAVPSENAIPIDSILEPPSEEEVATGSDGDTEIERPRCTAVVMRFDEQLGSTIVNGIRRSHRIAAQNCLGSYLDMCGRRRSHRIRRLD